MHLTKDCRITLRSMPLLFIRIVCLLEVMFTEYSSPTTKGIHGSHLIAGSRNQNLPTRGEQCHLFQPFAAFILWELNFMREPTEAFIHWLMMVHGQTNFRKVRSTHFQQSEK